MQSSYRHARPSTSFITWGTVAAACSGLVEGTSIAFRALVYSTSNLGSVEQAAAGGAEDTKQVPLGHLADALKRLRDASSGTYRPPKDGALPLGRRAHQLVGHATRRARPPAQLGRRWTKLPGSPRKRRVSPLGASSPTSPQKSFPGGPFERYDVKSCTRPASSSTRL